MDVAAAMDFDFNSSSYGGASYYNSAPSSPTRMTEFYCQFDELLISAEANHTNCLAAVPFAWEEKPGVPKGFTDSFEDDFSFDDLFLFRSASDGRAMDRDPLKKYSTISRKHDQDFRNSAEAGSVSKRRGRVSAHEQHYNLNRAVSNDMKKKTYLPYRHGILGGLAFNP
ncbi:hypothetical protein Ccrd_023421 [Cynara cardunculus var. scolymus]|uniref:Uncharacterized protein n=1 Tax=Cynara cardunculus var. scolymus TaxID=59895 RepID=A0A124SDY1_CYNCS|nr:hypothetical protein Ccrd_023421 [Cynara cardunculus var. scolymus]